MSGEATVHLLPDTWVKSGTWPDPSTPTILGPPDLEEKVPDPKDVVLHAKLFSGGQRSGVVSTDVMDTHSHKYAHTLSLPRSFARSLAHTRLYRLTQLYFWKCFLALAFTIDNVNTTNGI